MLLHKLIVCLLIFYCPFFALGKYTACFITINSSDEKEIFKQCLSPNNFDFIELLPSTINPYADHSSHWFNKACNISNLQCDLLVISGHFGGSFFGKSSYTLPTRLLEKKACNQTCPGILSHVKEIFLFGCNTLAEKRKDNRSYSEYLQVLLDHGMARATAERVVAARYSPLATPFYGSMNFIFSESSVIYGFPELSPLGPNIRAPLSNYCTAIQKKFGSYANYLQSGHYKRDRNTELFSSLSNPRPHQAHISIASENNLQKEFFKNKCLLYDDTKPFELRMQALHYMFEAKKAGFAFFAIDHFLGHHRKEIMAGKGRQIFRHIRTNQSFADTFRSYYKDLEFLPYIRLVYLNILEQFRWIDPFSLKLHMKKNLLEMLYTASLEAYTSLLLILKDNKERKQKVYVSANDLPETYIQNIWSLLIFEKLRVMAPDWQFDILQYCKTNLTVKPAHCYQALNTLAHIYPRITIAQSVVTFLNHKDDDLIYYTLRMLGQTGIQDYHIHSKIAAFLTHRNPYLRIEALEALGYLRSPYKQVQSKMARLLPSADKDLAKEIFWSLARMDITSQTAQNQIIEYIRTNNFNDSTVLALQALENTTHLFPLTLKFMYEQLDSQNDFVFAVVESLSRNPHLKDLGIHSRFLNFQSRDTAFKRQALRKMAYLNWMHPDIQLKFLNYIKDTDKNVRITAINLLRNISNLQVQTLDQIAVLHQEKGIKELEGFTESL